MIKIMTEDKNLTLKLPKEESGKLFSQLALILLGHDTTKDSPKLPTLELPPSKELAIKPHKEYVKVNYKSEKPKDSNENKYGGFLYIRCKHCGAIKGFCAKTPLSFFKCDCCGEKTDFSDERMVKMRIDCMNCGSHFDYHTNITDDMILYDCIKCQSPIDLVFNERRNQFNNLSNS